MSAWRSLGLLTFLVGGCASAVGPEPPPSHDRGTDGGIQNDGFASGPGVDLAAAPDLSAPPSGLVPGGSWTPIASPADLIGGALDSLTPSLTLHEGIPAVAWVERLDVRVATWSSSWTLLGGAINPAPGSRTLAPQLASRGGALAVALLSPQAMSGVNAAHVFGWSSGAWSPIGAAVPFQLSFLGDLAMSLDSAGHPFIAWTQQVGGASAAPSNVYVQRYDGATWSAWGGNFAAESPTSSALAAQLRLDAADHVYVSWQETFVHVYTDSGSWSAVGGSNGKLSAGATSSFEQQLTLDGMQRPLVAWMEYQAPASGIHVARYESGAWHELTTAPVSATGGSTNAALADLTVDATDGPVLSWSEDDGSGVETAWVALLGGGAPVYVGQPLHLPAGFRYLGAPQLAVDAQGVATLVFTGQQISDGKSRLFCYRYASP